ncbi:MAG TPA: MOSC domain-containing protein, partial [Nitrospiraceae bacterium]|nr:MOSC domain-containing protein [Nitrospiraceae bacterium]
DSSRFRAFIGRPTGHRSGLYGNRGKGKRGMGVRGMDRIGNRVCDYSAGMSSPMPLKPAHLYQINVSDGGVPKLSVGQARITHHGLDGDRQRNRVVHGGVHRAVCLFSFEVIEALRAEGHGIAPGSSGENLTVAGIDWSHLRPGVHLSVGEVRLEITSYTAPCMHNARWFKDGAFSRISQKTYPGWSRLYARVLSEGVVRTGDMVTIEEG